MDVDSEIHLKLSGSFASRPLDFFSGGRLSIHQNFSGLTKCVFIFYTSFVFKIHRVTGTEHAQVNDTVTVFREY